MMLFMLNFARSPLLVSRHISPIKFALRLTNLKCDKLSKRTYTLLVFDDAKSHYSWVSQVSELTSKYGIEMDDSDTRIKNKINCHFDQILMSKIGKALLDQRNFGLILVIIVLKQYLNSNHILIESETNKFEVASVVLE